MSLVSSLPELSSSGQVRLLQLVSARGSVLKRRIINKLQLDMVTCILCKGKKRSVVHAEPHLSFYANRGLVRTTLRYSLCMQDLSLLVTVLYNQETFPHRSYVTGPRRLCRSNCSTTRAAIEEIFCTHVQ